MTTETAETAELGIQIRRAKERTAAGQHKIALSLWTIALQTAKEAFGERHARVLYLTEELAECQEALGRWDQAAFHWSLAYNLSRDLHGLNECTGTIARRAGVACMRLKQRHRALPFWETALAIARKLYGETDPTTLFCVKFMSRCLAAQRQNQRVLELTEPICNAFFAGERLPAKYSEPIFHSMAQALTATGRHAESTRYWRTYSTLCSAHYGEEDRVTMNAWREWGCALGRSGHTAEAAAVLDRCRRLAAQIYGPQHQLTHEMAGLVDRYRDSQPAASA